MHIRDACVHDLQRVEPYSNPLERRTLKGPPQNRYCTEPRVAPRC